MKQQRKASPSRVKPIRQSLTIPILTRAFTASLEMLIGELTLLLFSHEELPVQKLFTFAAFKKIFHKDSIQTQDNATEVDRLLL